MTENVFVAPQAGLNTDFSPFTHQVAAPQAVPCKDACAKDENFVPAPPEARATENFEPVDKQLVEQLQQATASAVSETAASLSKGDLAGILEGFAKVLRADANYSSISFTDHMAEVSQLKELLLEAQETIINLLNDRVFDRAKLARLDAEIKLVPDLQSQAHRAMGLAAQTEEVQKELAHVRAEVERLRTSYIRSEQKADSWLKRLFKARS